MKASKFWNLFREMATVVYGARWHFVWPQDAMSNSNAVIIFTECRRLVNDTCAILIGNIGIHENAERLVLELGDMLAA